MYRKYCTGHKLISSLEELLIDFRELVGEHSGENMADAVWATLELYGLKERVNAYFLFLPGVTHIDGGLLY